MANVSLSPTIAREAGGAVPGLVLGYLLEKYKVGKATNIKVEDLALSLGESESSIRSALYHLGNRGFVSAPDGTPWSKVSSFKVEKIRAVCGEADQTELDLDGDNEEEAGDAGDGPVFVSREVRLWDERCLAMVILRAQVVPVHQSGESDGLLYHKLVITVRDNGDKPQNARTAVDDPQPFQTVELAFAYFDEWADMYEVENRDPEIETQEAEFEILGSIQSLVDGNHIAKAEGKDFYEVKLAKDAYDLAAIALDIDPDIRTAFFDAARNWSVVLDEEGIALGDLMPVTDEATPDAAPAKRRGKKEAA